MKILTDFTIGELKDAIRSKLERRLDRPGKLDKTLDIPDKVDFSDVIKYAELYTENIIEEGKELKDFYHYMGEKVMKAIYGPNFYKWVREVIEDV